MSAPGNLAAPEKSTGTAVSFELERFEWIAADRLEVAGRWYGVRGRRFLRPTLDIEVDGQARRMLALLEHKPWAPDEGSEWIAAFTWNDEPIELLEADLVVAPDLSVELPAPGTAAGAKKSRAAQRSRRRAGARAAARGGADAGRPAGGPRRRRGRSRTGSRRARSRACRPRRGTGQPAPAHGGGGSGPARSGRGARAGPRPRSRRRQPPLRASAPSSRRRAQRATPPWPARNGWPRSATVRCVNARCSSTGVRRPRRLATQRARNATPGCRGREWPPQAGTRSWPSGMPRWPLVIRWRRNETARSGSATPRRESVRPPCASARQLWVNATQRCVSEMPPCVPGLPLRASGRRRARAARART